MMNMRLHSSVPFAALCMVLSVAAQAGVDDCRRTLRGQEAELAGIEARARRSRDNAERVTNQAQYDAARREEASLRAQADALQDVILERMEALEALEEAARRTAAEDTTARAELASAEAEAGTRQPEVGRQLGTLRAERARVVAEMSRDVLARYERVKANVPRGGVTSVKDGTCLVCRRGIPPQIVNEAAAMKAVHACPSCNRLVLNVVWSSKEADVPTGS